ncbi:hypothetical protein HGRIS_001522 [Hohenbuehelia grisea]|uniref:Glucose-methanol-choline oxidoreductase C-terminal domain-containing protein n=1 Tax=Hohenbuehelia grisea TaxID=104357 RepID=A0ABR3JQ54_9AGAR
MHIASSNPQTPPTVDQAYWAHTLDVAAHVAGIKLARKMLTTAPVDSIYQVRARDGRGYRREGGGVVAGRGCE